MIQQRDWTLCSVWVKHVDTTHSKATTAAVTSRNYSTTQYQTATTINTTVDGFLMQQPHSSNTVDYIKCPVMLLCGSCTIIRTQLIIISSQEFWRVNCSARDKKCDHTNRKTWSHTDNKLSQQFTEWKFVLNTRQLNIYCTTTSYSVTSLQHSCCPRSIVTRLTAPVMTHWVIDFIFYPRDAMLAR